MKKAFTLIEIVTILAIVPFVLVVLGRLTTTFLRDIPEETAVLQKETIVLDLIASIGRDVDKAIALPDSAGEQRSDHSLLLIGQPEVTVTYESNDEQVVRSVFDREGHENRELRRQWRLPHAVVSWQRNSATGSVPSVEIQSYVRDRLRGAERKKLAQSRVFFLHALGDVQEVR